MQRFFGINIYFLSNLSESSPNRGNAMLEKQCCLNVLLVGQMAFLLIDYKQDPRLRFPRVALPIQANSFRERCNHFVEIGITRLQYWARC